jgi:autotransporter-associated beta strand protein
MWFSGRRRLRFLTPAGSRTRSARRASLPPRLERLEDRLAPATRVWDGGSPTDSFWSSPANWDHDIAPVAWADDLVFPATAARKASTNDFLDAAFLGITFSGSGYALGGNSLTLDGTLSADPGLPSNVVTLGITIFGAQTFQVGSGSVLTLSGVLDGAGLGFTKSGIGTLTLTGANTYLGVTEVSEGLLRVENPSALGSTIDGTVIDKGAIVRLVNIAGPVTFPPEPLTFGSGPVGQEAKLLNSISDATWSGPVDFEPGGNQLIGEPGKVLRFTGPISGAGGFRHIASGGTIEFAGSTANTYTGLTEIARGTLQLNKTPGVTAVAGPLSVGGGDANAGVVRLLAAEQIADTAAVTLIGGGGFFGTLDLGGFSETIGSLSGGTGQVLLGAGTLITGEDDSSTLFGGDITGSGGLIKAGQGTFTLSGTSTYTGPTTVSAGILRVDGLLSSVVTARSGGTLSGSGTTGGIRALPGGKVNPGTGPGMLTAAGKVSLGSGSTFVVELNGADPGTGYDQLRVTGATNTVSLGATLSIQLGFVPAGQSFTILDNRSSGQITGTFKGFPEGTIVRAGGAAFRITYQGGDGNDIVLTHLPSPAPGDIAWLRQFGSTLPIDDFAYTVASGGSVFVAGSVDGTLPGQVSFGNTDAYVRRYDTNGKVIWTRQFGSSAADYANGVAADASGVYVAGSTFGTLPGQTNVGNYDAFLSKYDNAGNLLWIRQFGSPDDDGAFAVAVGASGVYVAGFDGSSHITSGMFVRQYDTNGNLQWIRRIDDPNLYETARGIAVDDSGIYVAGEVFGPEVGSDEGGFVVKYDAPGNVLWSHPINTDQNDSANGVAVDATGTYVVGFTAGTLPGQPSAGGADVFVRKYDPLGNEVWTHQLGGSSDDVAAGVAVNASGVYVTGTTFDALPGQTSAGLRDAFLLQLDSSGNLLWTRQFGTATVDFAYGVAQDASGVYVVGFTRGSLSGQTAAGGGDAFVRKYNAAGGVLWTRQFGSLSQASDDPIGVAASEGNVYVAGFTEGTLPGQATSGNDDAFVRKYDATGKVLWTRQFGTSAVDAAVDIAADASGVYVAGYTSGTLPGQSSAGGFDAFVRKYDFAGHVLWTRQFGTSSTDFALGIAVDASGVYVTGSTSGTFPGQTSAGDEDVFVRKYDAAGHLLWTRQTGTSDVDDGLGIAVNASGVYVTGITSGTFPGQTSAGGQDDFVLHYDANGTELWTRQFGTSGPDVALRIAADNSGVYVVGYVLGRLSGQTSAGGIDAFVRKYDTAGNEVWTRQFGTPSGDEATDVAVDGSGVYVAGDTFGTLPGQTRAGNYDAFVRVYDPDGHELWTRQFGSAAEDRAHGVAADASALYVVGETYGTFGGQRSAGGADAFVARIVKGSPGPLPTLGGGDDGQGAPSAPLPQQPAPLLMAVRNELNLGSALSTGALERPASTSVEPTPGILVPETIAGAPLGWELGSPLRPGSSRPGEARQVLDDGTGFFLDGALLDELARSRLDRVKHGDVRRGSPCPP